MIFKARVDMRRFLDSGVSEWVHVDKETDKIEMVGMFNINGIFLSGHQTSQFELLTNPHDFFH